MAWSLTIAGVDRTHKILNASPPRLTININERATAQFSCHPSFAPNRFDDVVITYDGTNPAFRGLILHRTIVPIADEKVPYRTDVACVDYGATGDWCYATLNYADPVTLKQVLNDLCAQQLSAFGITLDPTQTVGPTLAPFGWNSKRVSDCLRELMDRTGYVYMVGPYRTLSAFEPGSRVAPLSITDMAPHIKSLTWTDPDDVPTNYLVVTCGPPGGAYQPYMPAYDIVADGVATHWKIPGPVPGVLSSIPWTPEGGTGSLAVDGYIRHCFVGFEEFIWNESTQTLSVGSAPIPTAGQHLTFQRSFQYPPCSYRSPFCCKRLRPISSSP